MRTLFLLRSLLILTVMICAAGSAWCSRKDNGGSNYGEMADGCPSGAGSSSSTFGSVAVLCYSPESSLDGVATILQLYSGTPISSLTLDVSFPDGDPTDTMTFGGNFGLITCDGGGSTVPCTTPSSTMNLITSGNDLVIESGSPDTTTLNLGNLDGNLVLYFTAPAFVTDVVTHSIPSPTPEPSSLALLGFGAVAIGAPLLRRRATKRLSL